jgi:uroporphyrinogen-III synthase
MANPELIKPLTDARVILTRPRAQALELATRFADLGAAVVIFPLIEICEPSSWVDLDRALGQIENYDWLILASGNAVDFFLHRFDEVRRDRALLERLKIAAVGRKTRERIEREGLKVVLTPDEYTAHAIVDKLLTMAAGGDRLNGLRALIPSSNLTRDVIRPALNDLGMTVDLVEAYQTVRPDFDHVEALQALDPGRGGYLFFASPSAVESLAAALDAGQLTEKLGGLKIVCIGPTTAAAAKRRGLTVDLQPVQFHTEAIIDLLIADYQPSQKY